MTHVAKGHKRIRVDVAKPLLQWAMDRSGKSVGELARKPDLVNLNEWITGTKKPTMKQLEGFARATYTPFGHLLSSKPPSEHPLPIPHFRTINDGAPPSPSLNLQDAIRIIQQRQEWVRDYLIEVGAEPLGFVGAGSVGDDPVDVANSMRNALELDSNWAVHHPTWEKAQKYLYAQMEEKRIFVSKNTMVQNNHSRPLDYNEFRGFVLVDEYAPFVFVNGADIAGAQMFTVAHELAHIWMGKSASFDLRNLAADPANKLETACNKIAAEFLVPTEELHLHWNGFNSNSDDPYKEASARFKVSRIVAARRALDVKLISQAEFDDFYLKQRQQKNRPKKKKGGPRFDALVPYRISKRFLRTAIGAVREDRLLYRDAYFLTGLRPTTFERISNRIYDA